MRNLRIAALAAASIAAFSFAPASAQADAPPECLSGQNPVDCVRELVGDVMYPICHYRPDLCDPSWSGNRR